MGTGARRWRGRGYLGSERPWPTELDTQRPLDSLGLPALLCHPIMQAQGFTVCTELFKPMTGRNSWAPLRAGKTGLKFGLGGPDCFFIY